MPGTMTAMQDRHYHLRTFRALYGLRCSPAGHGISHYTQSRTAP
ncbi:hypothetical protein [Arthrobacter sp. MAHUQ-56]